LASGDLGDGVLGRRAAEGEEHGSQWPGMTYEQGLRAGIDWILGDTDTNPMDD